MLWMHGQGLWHCFTTSNNSSVFFLEIKYLFSTQLNLIDLRSWETIFSKSTFSISENELKCCYRIIELCKDCVLIVYQYAFEQNTPATENATPTNIKQTNHSLYRSKHPCGSSSNLSIKSRFQ